MTTIVEFLNEHKNGFGLKRSVGATVKGGVVVKSRYAAVQVNPKFYEPIHTTNDWPVNIQLPSTLKETWKK